MFGRLVISRTFPRFGAMKKAYFSVEKDGQPNSYWANILDKHFGALMTGFGVLVTSYTAIHISDEYFSSIPGSKAEKRRLDKERLKEESRTFGKWEGFWTFWFSPAKKEDVIEKK
mmetsp:Transcript_10505/g.15791  ORF Transcript_10505/g.15791 Transcript_10505/m.15791 type:complete len:115 (+) Transcript_10505:120-464(+)